MGAALELVAGVLQHRFGWQTVNLGVLPSILLILLAVSWLKMRRAAARAVA